MMPDKTKMHTPLYGFPQTLPAFRLREFFLIDPHCARYLEDMMRLLGITAHPDDEAGAFGGSLLLYHARGIETYVICLTPGQAASNRGGARSDEELAELRRAEFADSCKLLHVTEGQILNYRDGALDQTDFFPVVRDLAQRIRKIKPHLILTMGSEGGITGHPDHSMASIFATMAFHWAARKDRYPEQLCQGIAPHQTQKLYYATAPFMLPNRPPVSLPSCTATIDIAPFVEEKIRAFQAHTTQAPLWEPFAKTMRKFGDKEYFHLAATNRPASLEAETDLLTGIQLTSP